MRSTQTQHHGRVSARKTSSIGQWPKLCVKIRPDSWLVCGPFRGIDDDNEMGHRPISYQYEFSRI